MQKWGTFACVCIYALQVICVHTYIHVWACVTDVCVDVYIYAIYLFTYTYMHVRERVFDLFYLSFNPSHSPTWTWFLVCVQTVFKRIWTYLFSIDCMRWCASKRAGIFLFRNICVPYMWNGSAPYICNVCIPYMCRYMYARIMYFKSHFQLLKHSYVYMHIHSTCI